MTGVGGTMGVPISTKEKLTNTKFYNGNYKHAPRRVKIQQIEEHKLCHGGDNKEGEELTFDSDMCTLGTVLSTLYFLLFNFHSTNTNGYQSCTREKT